jgi:hypothetical protein
MDSTVSQKVKIMEGEGVGARSLVHNTLGVEGHAEALRLGLGWVTSKLITHTDLHKLNNKLINVWLEHFGARMNHVQTWIHKIHHSPKLGEATTFPFIVYYVHGHGTNTQMSFCLKTPE